MNAIALRIRAFATAPPWLSWKRRLQIFTPRWSAPAMYAALFFLCAPPLVAQNQDAISREVSVFNFGVLGLPSAGTEAISREVSVFNFGQLGLPAAGTEAISREVSVFNFGELGLPAAGTEAISREVSVFNFGVLGLPSAGTEAISRELSVYNYGVPPMAVAVGSTNIVGNQISQVPFTFETTLDLTNLSLTLLTDDGRLQVLGVTPASPEVLGVTLGTPGVNSHPISFTLDPDAIPATNHTLAYLNFQGVTNLSSAVVPLVVSSFAGLRTSGQVAVGNVQNGQVIVIVNKPILFPTTSLPFGFTMFGVPGMTYSVQATTNLAPATWIEVQRQLESGATLTITGLSNSAPRQFYRTQQVGP